jgi:hypothetical protein
VLPGADTLPAQPLHFNINFGLARRNGGKGPDGKVLAGLNIKECLDVEGFAFMTSRANYPARVTDPGRNSVLRTSTYFKKEVIYVSRRRFNAGDVERALLTMCIDKLQVPHLINQHRGGTRIVMTGSGRLCRSRTST